MDCWTVVLSFATNSYGDFYKYSLVSKTFFDACKRLIDTEHVVTNWDMANLEPYDPADSFWNGFKFHAPFSHRKMTAEDIFSWHLLKSLKHFEKYRKRTDRILFYLAKTGRLEGNPDYLKCLSRFVGTNFANPVLYAYFDIRARNSHHQQEYHYSRNGFG